MTLQSKKTSYLLIGLNVIMLLTLSLMTTLTTTKAASSIAEKIKGRILLQVEQSGEAWYVNPVDLKRYYLGKPNDAFNIMRDQGLGITNNDLNQIEIGEVGTPKTTQVKVYFSSNLDTSDCSNTKEFLRNIPYTQEIGTAAINEILKELSEEESKIATNVIPSGTKLLNLEITDSIAYATFSKELQNYGGGSCNVNAIRSQIETTLKQFSTVNSVIISVEGIPQEEVLQP